MSPARRDLLDEGGAVLIAGLLLSLALLMLIGAAVDIGQAFIVHRELVTAADTAALTGSQQLDSTAIYNGQIQLDPEAAQQAALQSLSADTGLQAQTAADPESIEVTVRETIPTILLRLVGINQLTLTAQATAAPREP